MSTTDLVLKELRRWSDQRDVNLSHRLFEDLCLDDMEQAEIALRLEKAFRCKPSPEAYRTVFTGADLARVFEACLQTI